MPEKGFVRVRAWEGDASEKVPACSKSWSIKKKPRGVKKE